MHKINEGATVDKQLTIVEMINDARSRIKKLVTDNRIRELEGQIEDLHVNQSTASIQEGSDVKQKLSSAMKRQKETDDEIQNCNVPIKSLESKVEASARKNQQLQDTSNRKNKEIRAMEERYRGHLKKAKNPFLDDNHFIKSIDLDILFTSEGEKATNKVQNIFNHGSTTPRDYYLGDLLRMLKSVIACQPEKLYSGNREDAQDPSAVPCIWISRWVDYGDECGFGYQLCDNSVGVLFKDRTCLIMQQDGQNLHCVDDVNNKEQYFTIKNYPREMSQKVEFVNSLLTYMEGSLVKMGESIKSGSRHTMTYTPHLRAWFKTKYCYVFHLTNGTCQVNFNCHRKVILCPLMGSVSLIDKNLNFTVYTFKLIEKYGCSPLLSTLLRHSKVMVEKLYQKCSTREN